MAAATNTTEGTVLLAGDLHGTDATAPELSPTGVTPGVYLVSKMYIDSKGRTTNLSPVVLGDFSSLLPKAGKLTMGVMQIGNNINVSAGTISVYNASTTQKGVVQVGLGLLANAGVMSINESAFPVATAISKGVVQVGTGLAVTSGVMRIDLQDATAIVKGAVQIGSGLAVNAGVISVDQAYVNAALTVATTTTKGVVQVGTGLDVTAGTISVNQAYINAALPVATDLVQGIVQVGTGIDVNAGVISVHMDDATDTTKGAVQIGSGFAINAGVLSFTPAGIPDATTASKGLIQVGAGFDVTAGVISATIADSTDTTKGLVQVDSSLSVNAGVLSIPDAEAATIKGIVKSANALNLTIVDGVIDIGTNILISDVANTYTKAQVCAKFTDTFAASYTPDFSQSNVIELTLTGNITALNAPINAVPGGVYTVIFIQDATGSRTLSGLNAVYKWNATPTLSTPASKKDIFTFICKDATTFYVSFATGY